MDFEIGIRQYFKRDISYVLFTILVTVFILSLMLNFCYYTGCGLIPYWVELVPQLQIYFGLTISILILGILFTEYILK